MYLSCLCIDLGDNPDRPRPGRFWLRNLYHVHQRLCMAFPSDSRIKGDREFLAPYKAMAFPEQRHLADKKKGKIDHHILKQVHSPRNDETGFLFRIDPLPNGRAKILVQSALEPNWDYAFQNANFLLAEPPKVKTFEPRFSEGQFLRFRLAANPTRRLSRKSPDAKKDSIGKRVPVSADKLFDWLADRAETAGFSIERDITTLKPGYVFFKKYKQENGEKENAVEEEKTKEKEWQRLSSVLFEGILRVTDPDAFRQTLARGIGSGKAFGFGLLSIAAITAGGPGEAK